MVELLELRLAAQVLVDKIGTWWNQSVVESVVRKMGAHLQWKLVRWRSWLVGWPRHPRVKHDAITELILVLHRRAPRDAIGRGAALQAR
uniref:Uncharacterized protein n=1 Tax=Setaria viridis TaxID=4556 RepID=A0A4U6TKR8_SETVI|nr:hypothetical protein SEVIR_8G193133v2 [Setaria viridis]